mgnify:FL=1
MNTPPPGYIYLTETTDERNARIKHRDEHPHRLDWSEGASLWDTPSPYLVPIKSKSKKT